MIPTMRQLHALDNFLIFNSNDYQTIKEKISQYLCPHRFDVVSHQPLNTRLNGFLFGTSALYDLKYSAPVEITIDAQSEYYLFRLTLEGECLVQEGQQCMVQSLGIMTVSNPLTPSRIVTNQYCRNIILKLSKPVVETQLFKMLGYSIQESLAFENGLSCTAEGTDAIIQTLSYLCHAHDHIENWNTISHSFEQYLIELILLKLPNNYSRQLKLQQPVLLPSYMKRAKQYIAVHLQENITLTELGEYSGVSVRTLQKGFSAYIGQTPVEYIRDLRIQQVHQALSNAQLNDTVTEILLKNGINSFGHFSAQYKKCYGHPPSQTLKLAIKQKTKVNA